MATLFQDEIDFRFKTCGWCDFKLPLETPALESSITAAAALIPMDLSDLHGALEACEESGSPLWNKELLKDLIKSTASTILATDSSRMDNWEYCERALKESPTYFGSAKAAKVWVVHFWIVEEDGTVSHGYLLDNKQNNPGVPAVATEWLYFNKSRFKNISDALIIFPYDTTIAGTYHSIRGRGWNIQPQVITNNSLACRMADGAMAATMNLLQIKNTSQTEHDRMAVAHFGNNELLPAGVDYIDRKPVDYTSSVLPVIAYLQDSLGKNNNGARPQVPALDKNAPAVAHQLEAQNNAALSASALNRFHTQMDKLYTRMYRRAIAKDYSEDDPGGQLVKEFRRKLTDRGIDQKTLDGVEEITAKRTVGAGSAANRILSLQRVEQRQGSFDPEGRHNLTYDIIAEEVGEDLADRYMQPTLLQAARQPIDSSIAVFESFMFYAYKQAPVLPNQDHFVHVSNHLPVLAQRMDQLEQLGETAEIEQLIDTYQVLMIALPHIAQHTNIMAGDTTRKDEVKGIIQMAQQFSAAADRLRDQITRLQKDQVAQEEAEQVRKQEEYAAYVKELEAKSQQGGEEGQKAQSLIVAAQVKARISEVEHQQKMVHREKEFNQQKALKDAAMAAELLRKAELATTSTES